MGLDPTQDRTRIRRYKAEFIRILSGKATDYECDLPELLQDLWKLMNRGCPALDIVELMFGCTSGINHTFDDLLSCVGLTKRKLSDLKLACERSASIISMLQGRLLPGPFLWLPGVLPKGADPEQVGHQIKQLVDLLTTLCKDA